MVLKSGYKVTHLGALGSLRGRLGLNSAFNSFLVVKWVPCMRTHEMPSARAGTCSVAGKASRLSGLASCNTQCAAGKEWGSQ